MVGIETVDDFLSGRDWFQLPERCDTCGRFVSEMGAGVSWSQSWSYGWDGTPDIHDRTYRCSPCTDRLGIKESNCNPAADPWSGRNPLEGAATAIEALASKETPR